FTCFCPANANSLLFISQGASHKLVVDIIQNRGDKLEPIICSFLCSMQFQQRYAGFSHDALRVFGMTNGVKQGLRHQHINFQCDYDSAT
ncbi:Os11g0307950, partial [Oryza sativa Japonica Group]